MRNAKMRGRRVLHEQSCESRTTEELAGSYGAQTIKFLAIKVSN
jgi:hypothetical protein